MQRNEKGNLVYLPHIFLSIESQCHYGVETLTGRTGSCHEIKFGCKRPTGEQHEFDACRDRYLAGWLPVDSCLIWFIQFRFRDWYCQWHLLLVHHTFRVKPQIPSRTISHLFHDFMISSSSIRFLLESPPTLINLFPRWISAWYIVPFRSFLRQGQQTLFRPPKIGQIFKQSDFNRSVSFLRFGPLNRSSNASSMRRLFAELAVHFLTLLFRTTLAHSTYPSYDYGIDRSTIVKRQSSSTYATTGVHTGTGPNGSTPLRLEIRDLEKDPITWTLYILGLDMLQFTPQTQMLSWYQIAGM